jgi:methylated-DNA-protein-cysteine methyltransferase related protein
MYTSSYSLIFGVINLQIIEHIMAKDDDFYEKVYAVVRQIPYCRVTTYGAIARHIGAAGSARTVGYALNVSADIPAHRVVNRNGLLTGKNHFSGTTLMADLLRSEGIEVMNDRVVDLEKVLWKPGEQKH